MKKYLARLSRPLRFLVFSGIAAATNLSVGEILYGQMGWSKYPQYSLAVGLGFLAGMFISYLLNKNFTFEKSGKSIEIEIAHFILVSIIGLIISITIAQMFVFFIGIKILPVRSESLKNIPFENISHAISICITAFYSYLAHKLISFRKQTINDKSINYVKEK